MRTFLAIPLASLFPSEIAAFLNAIPTIKAVRWMPPEQIHITLHFFDETSEPELEIITPLMNDVAGKFPPFHLGLKATGVFPDLKHPRVMWIGTHGQTDVLNQLQSAIDSELAKGGFPIEGRGFTSHATFGRVKNDSLASSRDLLAQLPQFPQTIVKSINQFVLYQSRLSSSGSIYEILQTFSLSQKSAA